MLLLLCMEFFFKFLTFRNIPENSKNENRFPIFISHHIESPFQITLFVAGSKVRSFQGSLKRLRHPAGF